MSENLADYYASLEREYDGADDSLMRWQDYETEPYLELELVKRLQAGMHLPPLTVGMIRGDDPTDTIAEHFTGARVSMLLRRWEVNLQDEEEKLLPVEWEKVQQLDLPAKQAWMTKLLQLEAEASELMPFEAILWWGSPEDDYVDEGPMSPLAGIDPDADRQVQMALAPEPTIRTQSKDDLVLGLY